MPTYEYECTRCGIIIEEFKSMNAPRRQRCPECRGKVQRLISGGMGIHFKGSGFYVNDSKGKASSSSGGKSGSAGKKSD
jgi:putative FmdB family regulatory protein